LKGLYYDARSEKHQIMISVLVTTDMTVQEYKKSHVPVMI